MRIGGIASGMDTEQMVKDLIKAERVRVDKLLRQEQRIKWRQEAYHDVNRKMANFILNTRKALSGSDRAITTGTVERFDWVKSVVSSDESIVKATATTASMNGVHTVEVKSLAEVASITSIDITGTPPSMLEADGITFTPAYLGNEFTITTKTGSVPITIGTDTGQVKTIDDLVSSINKATDVDGTSLGLRASYDSSLGKLMVTTRETGKEQSIQMLDGTGTFVQDMFGATSYATLSTGAIKGASARIILNGDATEIEKPTNNFSVFGINLQLQSVSPVGTEVTLNVNADVDGIYKKVEEFIVNYNQMIDDVNGLLGQKFHRDFAPLTQEEKNAMSEDEVKLWEEKSKSGLLKQDEGLTRILQSTRTSIYNEVQETTGQFNHITNIGITTGSYQQGGKLVIDEEKLRAAISNDPEGVVNLLFKTSDTVVPTEGTPEEIRDAKQQKANETGIFQRIYDDMITGMKDVIRRSGFGPDASLYRTVQSNMLIDFVTSNGSVSVIDRDLSSINTSIAREERIIASREDRYWRQFSAMEKAMNQMQQQSSWLMNQLGMGQ